MTATCYGILLATCIFDVKRFQTFKFSWIDVPMAVWCICPFLSSLANNLGPYDGFSSTLNQVVTWGVPYLLGRIYLTDIAGMRQMAVGMFLGGLAYIPFCLFEVRMSPQLHRMFYGGAAFLDFAQSMRGDGWRPTVFMIHGLAVGAYMMAATLIGIWLWKSKVIREVYSIPMPVLIAALLVTFILLKSTGAYTLLLVGALMLFFGAQFRNILPIYVLVGGIIFYLIMKVQADANFTDQLTEFLSQFFNEERMQSLTFRFDNEVLLSEKARQQILFGWGGWGRNHIHDEYGKQITITDSLWVIAFGVHGLVGLISLFAAFLLPILAAFQSWLPGSVWDRRETAPAVALAMALGMYVADCLLNAMVNPIYIFACGGLAGFALTGPVRKRPPARRVVQVPAYPALPEGASVSPTALSPGRTE